MKKLKILRRITDKRGQIIDLIDKEKIDSVTLVTFKKGAIRGNHFHKKTIQWNFIIEGKILFVTCMPGKRPQRTILKKGELAIAMPKEQHALVGLEDAQIMVFTKGPRSASEYESDTFRMKSPLVEHKIS